MLTRLTIKNFKSIGDPGIDLELRPLTFLVGPNGSGKSSVLEALALLVQNPQGGNNREPFFLFSSWPEFFHKSAEQISQEIDILLQEDELSYRITYYPKGGYKIEPDNLLNSPGHESSQLKRILSLPRDWFMPISSHRGVIPHDISAGPLTNWVGLYGEQLPVVEHKLQENTSIYDKAKDWGKKFGVSAARSAWGGSNQLSSFYTDKELGGELPKAVASFGGRQAWVMVVQIFASQPGSLLTIEEPEISLHPEAQVHMAELLATAAAEGKQVLATTHSTFLLMGLTSAVQKKIIKPEQVVVYELEKDAKGTKLKKKLEMNKKGVLKGWVDSFSEVEKRLLREWTATLPKV